MTTYPRLPVTFERGEGAWLWDTQGRKYLDALSGIAVCGLGHAHPAITQALCEQAGRLLHTSNYYRIARQEELAAELTRLSSLDKVFFCNSGAEANEAAIKIARLHGHHKGIKLPTVAVMDNSFHGRTLTTLTATGNRRFQEGFDPLMPGFVRVPYNNLDTLRTLGANPDVVAVLIEPIQGESGVNMLDDDFLPQLRALCYDNDWLMMLDEVQTGMCRTGEWFAFQHTGILPDVMTLAKGLGNGVPIGACLARGPAAELFKPGNHGTTFGGNPLVCSVALAVVKTLEQQRLAERAATLGERMLSAFTEALKGNQHVAEIRGRGLMIGIELDRPCKTLMERALSEGLLISIMAERVIRLLPPLILSDDEAQQIVDGIVTLTEDFLETG